jgi:hypothetical protein
VLQKADLAGTAVRARAVGVHSAPVNW